MRTRARPYLVMRHASLIGRSDGRSLTTVAYRALSLLGAIGFVTGGRRLGDARHYWIARAGQPAHARRRRA